MKKPKSAPSLKTAPADPKTTSATTSAKPIPSAKLKASLLSFAKGAARIQMKYFQKVKHIERKKGAGIVTEADKKAEEYLIKNIFRNFPQSTIITEETGTHERSGALCWIVDPLDGTSNYAHGFPWFCVSIGLYENGQPRAGVIYQPLTKEMFYAERGKGAFLNGKRIKVSSTGQVADSLLGTGFYYTTGDKLRSELEIFFRVQDRALAVRRPGSAALDLAYVACGRYDGFWERGLSSWDVAAGFLLVTEAGGKLTDYKGKETTAHNAEVVATNGQIHSQILQLIQG